MYSIPNTSSKLHRREEVIKRSQFITTLAHVSSANEANIFIASIKKEFPDASHNCWAYVAGPPTDTAKVGMSDDGEPHGTAGSPMLYVLLHSDVGEIVAIVTRYFGGTKLGPGGLVKAYSGSVKNALLDLPLIEKRNLIKLTIQFDYTYITAIKLLVKNHDVEIINDVYEADVCMILDIPEEQQDNFIQEITNLTSGLIQIKNDQ